MLSTFAAVLSIPIAKSLSNVELFPAIKFVKNLLPNFVITLGER